MIRTRSFSISNLMVGDNTYFAPLAGSADACFGIARHLRTPTFVVACVRTGSERVSGRKNGSLFQLPSEVQAQLSAWFQTD